MKCTFQSCTTMILLFLSSKVHFWTLGMFFFKRWDCLATLTLDILICESVIFRGIQPMVLCDSTSLGSNLDWHTQMESPTDMDPCVTDKPGTYSFFISWESSFWKGPILCLRNSFLAHVWTTQPEPLPIWQTFTHFFKQQQTIHPKPPASISTKLSWHLRHCLP